MATHEETLNSMITVLNQRKDVLQGVLDFFRRHQRPLLTLRSYFLATITECGISV